MQSSKSKKDRDDLPVGRLGRDTIKKRTRRHRDDSPAISRSPSRSRKRHSTSKRKSSRKSHRRSKRDPSGDSDLSDSDFSDTSSVSSVYSSVSESSPERSSKRRKKTSKHRKSSSTKKSSRSDRRSKRHKNSKSSRRRDASVSASETGSSDSESVSSATESRRKSKKAKHIESLFPAPMCLNPMHSSQEQFPHVPPAHAPLGSRSPSPGGNGGFRRIRQFSNGGNSNNGNNGNNGNMQRRGNFKQHDVNPNPNKVIGVFGLNPRTNRDDLRQIFSSYGHLEKVYLVSDHDTGNSKGFAFLTFKDLDAAIRARDEMNGQDVDGRKVRVDFSFTNKNTNNRREGNFNWNGDKNGEREKGNQREYQDQDYQSPPPSGNYERSHRDSPAESSHSPAI
ncbi:hypothetical protein BJ742DRAFT_734231 [Cladochytrium replicatum]|nr:hypothetical protein BJ742DRAFT_734231 [Cladochytrium replicatum]